MLLLNRKLLRPVLNLFFFKYFLSLISTWRAVQKLQREGGNYWSLKNRVIEFLKITVPKKFFPEILFCKIKKFLLHFKQTKDKG